MRFAGIDWRKSAHSFEDNVADSDFLAVALQRAFATMTDRELLAFTMHYICDQQQKAVGRALGGISQVYQ